MTVLETIWTWAATSLSGRPHEIAPAWAYWHARLMVAAWSVLLPLGMLMARFFKIWPGQDWPAVLDNPRWWRLHVRFQGVGVALMTCGFALAVGRGEDQSHLALWHHRAGWLLVSVGWLQIVAGIFRGSKGGPTGALLRGDHYDMTRRRLVFEVVHKTLGWAALPVVVATTAAGLVMLDAPRWVAVVIGAWWIVLTAAFVLLQCAGRCVDTYQAIWGPDPAHPGNQRKPIGWRVTRRTLRSGENQESSSEFEKT